MTVPSKQQPPKTVPQIDGMEDVQDDESRDTGSFKATLPELGGFLTKDGKPYRPASPTSDAEDLSPSADIPFYRDDASVNHNRWITLASTLAIVLGVALIMSGLLWYILSGDAIGNAGDLVDVLRTNI